MQAGVYVRISRDLGKHEREEGILAGVERQEADARALAESRGWAVAELYQDNDVSAYSGKVRPAWRRMLADLEAGRIQSVIAWANDRLYRRVRDQLDLIEHVADAGGMILTVKDGEMDPASASGKMAAGILAQVAEFESARKAERIQAKHADLARAGRWQGGNRRPFGYDLVGGRAKDGTPVTLKPRPDETKIIRAAVRAILTGGSNPTRIAQEWNEAGVKTPGGYRWTTEAVRRTLTSSYLAGIRDHGRRVKRNGGTVREIVNRYPADWPAILSAEEHELLRARLASDGTGQPAVRRYPLTGLTFCSRCGARMIGSGGAYRCQPRRGGCNAVRIAASHLEPWVLARVLAHEREREAATTAPDRAQGPSEGEKALLGELRDLESRRDALVEDIAEGRLDRGTGYQAVERVKARIQEVERKLQDQAPPPRAPTFWETEAGRKHGGLSAIRQDRRDQLSPADVQHLHDWVAGWVERIIVSPATHKGRPPTDPEKVARLVEGRVQLILATR
jgi:site-specific DNA recombinase